MNGSGTWTAGDGDLFADLANLVATDTVSPMDGERLAACGVELARHGCRPVGDGLFGHGDTVAPVWLYTHVDTKPPVPREGWSGDPFTLRVEDGRWIGLGVSDAKSQLLAALRAADPERHFVLIDTCEEYDGDGSAARFITAHRPRVLLICDGALGAADLAAGHLGQVDGEFTLDTGREPMHPARSGGDVAAELARLLADMTASGLPFTVTGLAAPRTERSLSLQQATLRFDLRYGPEQEDVVRRFLDQHPHQIRQRLHPVVGTEPAPAGVGAPAASASRLGVAGPLGVPTVVVVPGADPDNRNHQPDEFIRPGQADRQVETLRTVLAALGEAVQPGPLPELSMTTGAWEE